MTVETIETVTEALLDDVSERLFFDGETLAIYGDYDDHTRTFSREEVEAAITAFDAGAEKIVFDDDRYMRNHDHEQNAILVQGGNAARATQYKRHDEREVDGLKELIEAVE